MIYFIHENNVRGLIRGSLTCETVLELILMNDTGDISMRPWSG